MVKIEDCSHMELKMIYRCDINISGKKAVCMIDVANEDFKFPKRIMISLSNLHDLLLLFDVDKMSALLGAAVKCFVHKDMKKIVYIKPFVFDENLIRCNEVDM